MVRSAPPLSEPDRAREPAADDEDARRFSLRVFGRRHPKTITLAWVLLTAALIAALWSRGGVAVTGGVDGLTPEAHRTDRAALWLLVRLTDGPDEDDEAAREARADVALQLGERLEPLRAPLAPPLTDL